MSAPLSPPLRKAARTANVWGWSYILTILGAFGAGYVDPGPLRVLLLNFGILCFIIGVLELVFRHKLLQTGDARWARILSWNQVAGTLTLLWSLYLLYQIPETVLLAYARHSDLWNNVIPLLKNMDPRVGSEEYLLHVWHNTKMFAVYVLGGALILSQFWVVWHYRTLARQIEQTPAPAPVPPVLN